MCPSPSLEIWAAQMGSSEKAEALDVGLMLSLRIEEFVGKVGSDRSAKIEPPT